MGRAHARAVRVDEYLSVPKRGRPDLRVVEGGGSGPAFAPPAERPATRSLRPDWLPEDLLLPDEAPEPRRSREPEPEPPSREPEPKAEPARRTVVVAGRPEDDLRFEAHQKKTRRRRSPTAARLAGRPDRVAGWAVALGIAMALMAGATAGSEPKAAGEAAAPNAPALGR